MKKVFIVIAFLFGAVSASWAQVDDVTLVVSGEGVTKDEATTKALRSAIEQAFGVFVSANTEILNDNLVKDEIATVSSGNIKSYTELGTITKDNGNTEVSLQATVSVKKLTTYAKSHGSSCEFAGATFAANMKLVELNKENTRKALENLYRQIDAIGTELYTCDIETKNIRQDGLVQIQLTYYANEKAVALGELIKSTLEALSIPDDVVETLTRQGVQLYQVVMYYYGFHSELGKGAKNLKDLKNQLSGKMVADEHSRKEYITTYYPVELPFVMGRLYAIYDNIGNQYEFRLHPYFPTGNRIIRIRDSKTLKIWRKTLSYNYLYSEEKKEVEDFVKKKFPCLSSDELPHYNWESTGCDLRYCEENGFHNCDIRIKSPCTLTLDELLTETELWEKKDLSYDDYKGYVIIQEGGKIGIPAAYLDWQTGKKKKNDPAVFIPHPLFVVPGFITIPPERINQITNLYVK